MVPYIIIFIIEALILGIGVLIGYKRGMVKTAIRLLELIIAAIASLFIGKWLSELVSDKVFALVYANLDGEIAGLLESAPQATELVAGLVGALLMPVIFSLVFILLELLSLIGLSALAKLLAPHFGEQLPPTKKSKWIGAGISALSSLLVAVVVLSPCYTGLRIVANVPSQTLADVSEELGLGRDAFSALPENDMTPPLSSLIVNAATSFGADGASFRASEETPRLLHLAGDVLVSYNKSKDKGESSLLNISAAISSSVSHLKDSEYISRLTTSLLNAIGESIKGGNDIFGIAKGQSGATADIILNSVGNMLTGVTPDNIADNIAAIAGDGESEGVLTVITEITSEGDIKDVLADKEKVDKLADSLISIAENPNLSATMDALAEMGTGVIAEALPEEGSAKREEYLSKMSESVNKLLSATKETKDNFEESVNIATNVIMETISESGTHEITEGEAKIISICALHYFGTEENYESAGSSDASELPPISVEDIEEFLGLTSELPTDIPSDIPSDILP